MDFYTVLIKYETLEHDPTGQYETREEEIWRTAQKTLLNDISKYFHEHDDLSTAAAFYNYLNEKWHLDAYEIRKFASKDDTGIRKAFKLLNKND